MSTCEHVWRQAAHIDGCHWYRYSYGCRRCGAWRVDTYEREPDEYWAAFWKRDGCRRCTYLGDGAPRHEVDVVVVAP
jgi:hypothetical protein